MRVGILLTLALFWLSFVPGLSTYTVPAVLILWALSGICTLIAGHDFLVALADRISGR